jgi:hypothetical protein
VPLREFRRAYIRNSEPRRETLDGTSIGRIGRIIDAMHHERYRFVPARWVHIPQEEREAPARRAHGHQTAFQSICIRQGLRPTPASAGTSLVHRRPRGPRGATPQRSGRPSGAHRSCSASLFGAQRNRRTSRARSPVGGAGPRPVASGRRRTGFGAQGHHVRVADGRALRADPRPNTPPPPWVRHTASHQPALSRAATDTDVPTILPVRRVGIAPCFQPAMPEQPEVRAGPPANPSPFGPAKHPEPPSVERERNVGVWRSGNVSACPARRDL